MSISCGYCEQAFKIGAKKGLKEEARFACSDTCCKAAWDEFRKLGYSYTYIFQRKAHPAGLHPSSDELTRAFTKAAEEAVQEHHAAGHSVYGMADGEIVEIPPPDLET